MTTAAETTDVIINTTDGNHMIGVSTELLTESTTSLETIILGVKETATKPWFHYASYAIVPLLLFVGLFGNTTVIIIMARKHFRTTTTAVFVIALALSDTKFILLFPFTKSFTNDIFGLDAKAITLTGCKAFFCMFRSAKIFSSWVVVLICIERFIVVWFPLQAKRILTRQTAIILVVSAFCATYIFDAVWSYTTSIVKGTCIPNYPTVEKKDFSMAFLIAGTVIYNVLPSIFLVSLTPLTIFKLMRHRAKRLKMTGSKSHRTDETYRITRMLLAVTIAYVILVTPISVAHSIAFFSGDNIFQSTNEDFIIFREIAQIGEQLNYVVNFFIYVMFNSTFRRNFLKVFCRRDASLTRETSHRTVENRTSGDRQSSSLHTDTSVSKIM